MISFRSQLTEFLPTYVVENERNGDETYCDAAKEGITGANAESAEERSCLVTFSD